MVRQFTATELAPESAYIFRLSAKTRQGWGEPLEATVITTEKRGKLPDPDLTVDGRALAVYSAPRSQNAWARHGAGQVVICLSVCGRGVCMCSGVYVCIYVEVRVVCLPLTSPTLFFETVSC